jgi:hydrogenase expression/formation protein HypE
VPEPKIPTAAAFSTCPVPLSHRTEITVAHGGGGKLTQELIDGIFRPAFGSAELEAQHDGAVAMAGGARLAFTTDSHVVSPLFFPGSDIGKLAVNGTVNDLCMCGARPLWLSAGFILEEGLPVEMLRRVVDSMAQAATEAGVRIVTGDTKVVERGRADGLYVTTAGVGIVEHGLTIGPVAVREGDAVILSGDLGRHGMAVMAVRAGSEFESAIESDCAPLVKPVARLLAAGIEVHCLRDLTRGGLATALVEIAEASGLGVVIDEALVPVTELVRGACEILGLDPLYVANEGRMVCFVPAAEAKRTLVELRGAGLEPIQVGVVRAAPKRSVALKSVVGVERVLDRLSGEQLPRIC